MLWLNSIENFENTLKEARRLAKHLQSARGTLLASALVVKEGNERLRKYANAEQFLINLEELKSFCPRLNEIHFIRLLDKASLAVHYPDCVEYCEDFYNAIEDLHPLLEAPGLNSKKEASRIVDASAFNATAGVLMAGVLAAAIGIVVLVGAGPLGLLAFAAAGALAALIVSAISLHNINKNADFIEDKQFKVIEGFAGGLLDAAREKQITPGARL